MRLVTFDVRGAIGHFRRPDTTATHLTYPFITPTAARGLVGAILGIEDFMTNDKVGIQVLSPIRTSTQQMSMLGGNTFNRPTTVELLVNPAYRIFYTGEEYTDCLIEALIKNQSVYSTYLGVAYALTKPVLYKIYNEIRPIPEGEIIETSTIVPTTWVESLIFQEHRFYSRAGGFMKKYLGNREFERSIHFLFERNGKSICFYPKKDVEEMLVVETEDGAVCLV